MQDWVVVRCGNIFGRSNGGWNHSFQEYPGVDQAKGRKLILQVDLQPRKRHWLEMRMFPDLENFDVEMLNDNLDEIKSPVVNIRVRFQVFFAIWDYEGYNISITKHAGAVVLE
jgi:hypothetical protein